MVALQIIVIPDGPVCYEENCETEQEAHDKALILVAQGAFFGYWEHDHEAKTWTCATARLVIQIIDVG